MFSGASSGSLDALLVLTEYMGDAKSRAKEVRELVNARDSMIKQRDALAKEHGGVKKLEKAEETLREAERLASERLSDTRIGCDQLIKEAQALVGDLKADREDIEALKEVHNDACTSFAVEKEAAEAELKRREGNVTKREQNIGRQREELRVLTEAASARAERVAAAMQE